MKHLALICLLFPICCFSQSITEDDKFVATLIRTQVPPDGLVSGRSLIFFSDTYSQDELRKIQNGFQQTGVDAVEYYRSEMIFAGKDIQIVYTPSFIKRNVKFVIFARKENNEFHLLFLPFNPRYIWIKPGQQAWDVHAFKLQDALVQVFRALSSNQKKENFLINDFPEQEPLQNIFSNVRNESLISNLKNFKIAVPGMGDKEADAALSDFLAQNYHGKYELVPDTLREKDMIQKGFRYVLRYVHAPGNIAKEILGYDMSKSESALASVTYPNGALQLKTIPSGSMIYKFYFKDLDDKNLYLGLKWDSDVLWLDALKNFLDGYRVTGRLN